MMAAAADDLDNDNVPLSATLINNSHPANPRGCLPDDILLEILKHTEPLDAARYGQCSSVWRSLCTNNLVWKHNALDRWTCWASKPADNAGNWWEIFRDRHIKDRKVQHDLDRLIKSPKGRLRAMVRISELQEDAVDVLQRNAQMLTNDYLARAYHVDRALNLINRRWVIGQWISLCPQPLRETLALGQVPSVPSEEFTLEYGAFLLCKFVDRQANFKDIIKQLDELAEEARAHVMDPDSPDAPEGNVIEVRARQLYAFLFGIKGFGGATNGFYDVENSLIDRVLSRRVGIPISLALIYHAVGSRLGLDIEMISFPQHFLAKVRTEDGREWYIDCFKQPAVQDGFRSRSQCLEALGDMHLGNRPEYLEPVGKSHIFGRMASNIITTVNHARDARGTQDLQLHAYGSMMLLLVLSPASSHMQPISPWRRFLYGIMSSEYPEDVWFGEADLRLLRMQLKEGARVRADTELLSNQIAEIWMMDDAQRPVIVKDREAEDFPPTFKVGTLIRHLKYDYRGVIYGWDKTFAGDDGWWARQVGVETLRRGRNQPFYNVLSLDVVGGGGSTATATTLRYVAEENMEAVDVDALPGIVHAFEKNREIGTYFKRWDKPLGRFVVTDFIRKTFVHD
ncbi:Transglutaminase-like superfamily-domain-containing protein [Powellomyces hirtus]|nr:Transglutaminase-like superfamily-domain-containing protein [Powellomyces hirtus]